MGQLLTITGWVEIVPKPYRFSSGFPDSFQWDSFNFLSAGRRAV